MFLPRSLRQTLMQHCREALTMRHHAGGGGGGGGSYSRVTGRHSEDTAQPPNTTRCLTQASKTANMATTQELLPYLPTAPSHFVRSSEDVFYSNADVCVCLESWRNDTQKPPSWNRCNCFRATLRGMIQLKPVC